MKIVRGIVLTVLLILLFGLVGGMLAKFTNGYKNWDVEQWFVTSAVSTVSDVKNGSSFIQNDSKIDPIDVPSVPDEVQDPEDPTEPSGPEDPVEPEDPVDPEEPEIIPSPSPVVFNEGFHLYLNPDVKEILSDRIVDLQYNAAEIDADYSCVVYNKFSDTMVELGPCIEDQILYVNDSYNRRVLAILQVDYTDANGQHLVDFFDISIVPLSEYWDYHLSIPAYSGDHLVSDISGEFVLLLGRSMFYESAVYEFYSDNNPMSIGREGPFDPDFFPSDIMLDEWHIPAARWCCHSYSVAYIVPGEEDLFYTLFSNVPFEG